LRDLELWARPQARPLTPLPNPPALGRGDRRQRLFREMKSVVTIFRNPQSFSTVPQEIVSGRDVVTARRNVVDPLSGDRFTLPGLQPTSGSVYLTLVTSMFMHGGLAHLFGNMLFLWIFGDNLENALCRKRYLSFYMVCGVITALSHVAATSLLNGNMLIPSLRTSGAISGVLGGSHPVSAPTSPSFDVADCHGSFMALGMWVPVSSGEWTRCSKCGFSARRGSLCGAYRRICRQLCFAVRQGLRAKVTY
jgi:rhomboid family protein